MDFAHSDKAQDYMTRVWDFMWKHVFPAEPTYFQQLGGSNDFRQWTIPPVMEELKEKAKSEGLWNLFLPGEHGAGLDNRDYAPLAELMGRSFIASEVFNCAAPDTGNMEVLVQYGTDEQKERWLKPLLDGTIRSGFAMTEPAVASSDATNMEATAKVDGDEIVINGRKWWTSGAGDPRCKFVIFMGVTDPEADRHSRHSMVLVPLDTPGVEIEAMLPVFGHLGEPHGHAQINFNDVRVPASCMLLGPGRGFEIAQGRLGPGRIHHCMRAIGGAEQCYDLMMRRSLDRVAFGKPLANLGGNRDVMAECRMSIEQARLLTLKAAYELDVNGLIGAYTYISQIKVIAPRCLEKVADAAIQMYGGGGVSHPQLTMFMATGRVLRIADGPDEVHRGVVARMELSRYRS